MLPSRRRAGPLEEKYCEVVRHEDSMLCVQTDSRRRPLGPCGQAWPDSRATQPRVLSQVRRQSLRGDPPVAQVAKGDPNARYIHLTRCRSNHKRSRPKRARCPAEQDLFLNDVLPRAVDTPAVAPSQRPRACFSHRPIHEGRAKSRVSTCPGPSRRHQPLSSRAQAGRPPRPPS